MIKIIIITLAAFMFVGIIIGIMIHDGKYLLLLSGWFFGVLTGFVCHKSIHHDENGEEF